MKMMVTRPADGFSIIAVLFLLVVLAGLGAVIVQISTTQHLSTLNAQQSRQAHYAARAAGDWARHRLTVANQGCGAIQGQTLNIAGHVATISACTEGAYDESGAHTVFKVTVDAVANAGALDEARRTMRFAVYR